MTGILLIMAACLFWALDTLFRYPLLGQGLTTLQIVWLEHLLLVVITLPWLWRQGLLKGLMQRRNLPAFFVIGGLGSALGTLAFTQAFSLINPSLVILLQKLQPLVAISLAYFWLKEPITRRFVGWAALCFVGSFLLMQQDLQALLHADDLAINRQSLLGYGLALVAVVSWGSATVFGKHLIQQGVTGSTIMGGRFLMGWLCLTPLFVATPSASVPVDSNVLQAILAMVVLSGLLGMAFYYQGLKRIPSRLAALAEMFFPVAAITVNWLVLDMALESVQLIGAALLLLGSVQVQRRALVADVA